MDLGISLAAILNSWAILLECLYQIKTDLSPRRCLSPSVLLFDEAVKAFVWSSQLHLPVALVAKGLVGAEREAPELFCFRYPWH